MHNVKAIVPQDDGFHGSKKLAAEWWYFDGVFGDDYSFHIGIRTFSRKNRGTAILIFELYQKEAIIFEKRKRFSFKDMETTQEYPSVTMLNQSILDFDIQRYKKEGTWVYRLHCTIDDSTADLVLTGITQGFKIETPKESWTVALPKATVKGTIKHNGNTLSVNGIGYHDHNWNYTLLSALTYGKGWYWGKIKSNTITIVWANVLKRSGYQDLLAIVCPDHDTFHNINPETMTFQTIKHQRYKRRTIPSQISLTFKDETKETRIEGSFLMDVQHIHYSKVFFASYWRYHVNIKGSITVNDTTEHMDTRQIMEYLSMF